MFPKFAGFSRLLLEGLPEDLLLSSVSLVVTNVDCEGFMVA